MLVDHTIQAWLETDNARGNLITPYVRSAEPRTLQYRVQANKEGAGGRSQISQSGTVTIEVNQPKALGSIGLSVSASDTCRIQLTLADAGVVIATYDFPCPR